VRNTVEGSTRYTVLQACLCHTRGSCVEWIVVNAEDVPKSVQEFTRIKFLSKRRGHWGWDFTTLVPRTQRTLYYRHVCKMCKAVQCKYVRWTLCCLQGASLKDDSVTRITIIVKDNCRSCVHHLSSTLNIWTYCCSPMLSSPVEACGFVGKLYGQKNTILSGEEYILSMPVLSVIGHKDMLGGWDLLLGLTIHD
jgi:hypothetical protein